MSTAKDIMDQFIYRAKNLKEFEVTTTVPDNFRFNGMIPFDMKIDNETLTAKVWAVEFEEAAQRLDDFLESCK